MVFETPHGDTWPDAACPDWFRQIVDDIPAAVMICDPATFDIVYVNEASKSALDRIEHVLPFQASDVLGTCFDILHEDPSLRQLLSDPRNLPHKAEYRLGDQRLELRASPVHDDRGRYSALTVIWRIMTSQVRVPDDGSNIVELVPPAADGVGGPVGGALRHVGHAAGDAKEGDADAGDAREIAAISDKMLNRLAVTAETVKMLAKTVREIGDRTNLLAQNAAIEDAKRAAAIVNEVMNKAPGAQGAPAHDLGGNVVVWDASGKSDGTADDAPPTPVELSKRVEKLRGQLREIQEAKESGD